LKSGGRVESSGSVQTPLGFWPLLGRVSHSPRPTVRATAAAPDSRRVKRMVHLLERVSVAELRASTFVNDDTATPPRRQSFLTAGWIVASEVVKK
jgi:hypothetical protein